MKQQYPTYDGMREKASLAGLEESFETSFQSHRLRIRAEKGMMPKKAKKLAMESAFDEIFPPRIGFEDPSEEDFVHKQVVGNAEAIDWVFNNVAIPRIHAKNAPSAGAFGLYNWARDSSQNLSAFYATIWKARIPTRQQVETANNLQDDPRDQSDLTMTLFNAAYGKAQDEAQPILVLEDAS